MRRVLDGQLRLWHLVVIAVPLAALVFNSAAATATTMSITSLQPAGQIRMGMTNSTQSVDITGTDAPPVKVLTTSIVIPSGKVGDIQAVFTASLHHLTGGTYAYCFGSFNLDAGPPYNEFNPKVLFQLLGGAEATEPDAVGVSMSGFLKGVASGTHTINVYITSAYDGCELQERELNVLVNLR